MYSNYRGLHLILSRTLAVRNRHAYIYIYIYIYIAYIYIYIYTCMYTYLYCCCLVRYRWESLHRTADVHFNIELIIRNMMQAPLAVYLNVEMQIRNMLQAMVARTCDILRPLISSLKYTAWYNANYCGCSLQRRKANDNTLSCKLYCLLLFTIQINSAIVCKLSCGLLIQQRWPPGRGWGWQIGHKGTPWHFWEDNK